MDLINQKMSLILNYLPTGLIMDLMMRKSLILHCLKYLKDLMMDSMSQMNLSLSCLPKGLRIHPTWKLLNCLKIDRYFHRSTRPIIHPNYLNCSLLLLKVLAICFTYLLDLIVVIFPTKIVRFLLLILAIRRSNHRSLVEWSGLGQDFIMGWTYVLIEDLRLSPTRVR